MNRGKRSVLGTKPGLLFQQSVRQVDYEFADTTECGRTRHVFYREGPTLKLNFQKEKPIIWIKQLQLVVRKVTGGVFCVVIYVTENTHSLDL
jgi:hypothetical protein